MNRKLVGGSVGVVLALVAIWYVSRDGDSSRTDKAAEGSGRSAAITPAVKPPEKQPDEAAPRGMTPKFSLDVDPQGALQLEGQVLGPDGSGVANAEVWLGSVPPRTTKTEQDGTFSFDKLVGRTYALSAKSTDLIGGPITYKLTAKSDPVVIRMTEGATVIVTVVDDAKQPIAGVDVKAGSTIETIGKTDAAGMATLRPVLPGYVGVEAQSDGYAPVSGFTMVGSAGAVGALTLTLRRGFALTGRVIDDAGKPVAKARVGVGGVADEYESRWTRLRRKDPSSDTTDEKGQFTIAAVAAGTHVLHAVDGEHAPARSSPITVTDRAVSGLEIVMKAGGVVAGKVVDVGGKPVPGATVRLAGAGDDMMQVDARQAVADDQGTFELRGVTRAKLHVRAESEAAASKLAEVDLSEKRELRGLELVLDVTGTISGVVVDDTGAPVPEIQVSAFPDVLAGASTEGLMLAGMSTGTTDGAGAFTITGLPDGAYKLWAVRSSNGGGWGRQNTSAKTGDKNVRITLAAPGGLKGKIVIAGGGTPKLASVGIGWQAPTPAQDGVFELKELAPGKYDVSFRSPEFALLVKRDIEIAPGKTLDLGEVTVHRGRKVTGTVVDAKGKKIAGAKVKLGEMLVFSDEQQPDDDGSDDMEGLGGIRSATSDQDGRFAIIGAPAKATTLAADHPTAGRSASVAIGEGTQDPPPVTLQLRGFGTISGKVTQRGKPVANVSVTHSSKTSGAQFSGTQTDDQGAFTMKKVPEGTVVLQAMKTKMMSLKAASVTVQVTAGKETKVTIDIPVGEITLVVQLKAVAGQQLDAAQVFLFAGTALPANGKQLMDSFIGGGAQGMKFWFGPGKPAPEFEELVPGDYSICTIPITGDMNDPQFMQRIQENVATLKVYCRKTTVTAAPLKQTITQELPAMTPLPAPAP